MDSKAIAIVIIGVGIFVLVLSSAIGDGPTEAPYVSLVTPAKARVLTEPATSSAVWR